jgi:1-deoxy-D-xylulose-5-phosphate synthase
MVGPAMLFESFGFRYIGPVDGHNTKDIITALEHARTQDVPVIVHARTKKGKGYEPAEADPITWHGVTPFDRERGQFSSSSSSKTKIPSYTSVFAHTITQLANSDPRVVAITAAMPSGTGLDLFRKQHPDRYYDVGICEQHAVTFAAGLATQGMRPICAIYSTFLQRGFDQVIHDVCIQNLPVIFAIDRAGMVGNDGETHQGVFDISLLRALPNLRVISPKDEAELQSMLASALQCDGPVAIRYPRGEGQGVALHITPPPVSLSSGEILRCGERLLLIGFGPLTHRLCTLADQIKSEFGFSPTVINARSAKPLDEELLRQQVPLHATIVTLEDHSLYGGFGSAIAEFMFDNNMGDRRLIRFGAKDFFTPHASQNEQHQLHGYDLHGMLERLTQEGELVPSKRRAQA